MTLLFLFTALFATGLFFILADFLKLPTFGAAKTMLGAGMVDFCFAGSMKRKYWGIKIVVVIVCNQKLRLKQR